MRKSRVKEDGSACYHVMSRAVDRRMILNSAEKKRLKDLFRRMESFSGVKVLTQTILGNHFHLLLHVPAREHVADHEFIERLGYLYDKREVAAHADALQRLRKDGLDAAAEEYKQRFTHKEVERVLAAGGSLSMAEVLRCRVRYFCVLCLSQRSRLLSQQPGQRPVAPIPV